MTAGLRLKRHAGGKNTAAKHRLPPHFLLKRGMVVPNA
jgi:hypothetical protein